MWTIPRLIGVCMRRFLRHDLVLVRLLVLAALLGPMRTALAQSRTFTACTPDLLAVCAELRLTAGPSTFEIGVRTLAANGVPGLPVSLYNLIFGTGATAAITPVTTNAMPVAVGGAGYYHYACALRRNGSITCWGDNAYGQASPRQSATLVRPLSEPASRLAQSTGRRVKLRRWSSPSAP